MSIPFMPGAFSSRPVPFPMSIPFMSSLPDFIPGMVKDIDCIADWRFVYESMRNCADVTTRSPALSPVKTGIDSPCGSPTETSRGSK